MALSDLEWQQNIQRHEASRGLSATAELVMQLMVICGRCVLTNRTKSSSSSSSRAAAADKRCHSNVSSKTSSSSSLAWWSCESGGDELTSDTQFMPVPVLGTGVCIRSCPFLSSAQVCVYELASDTQFMPVPVLDTGVCIRRAGV